MHSQDLYCRIKGTIDTFEVIDSHEHIIIPEEEYLSSPADFARFFVSYTIDDIESAGAVFDRVEFRSTNGRVLKVNGRTLSLEEKWNFFKPYWNNVKFTGYGRAARLSIKRLLGINDLDDSSYREVSEKLDALMKPGVYHTILKDICGLKYILNDVDFTDTPRQHQKIDRTLFHIVGRTRNFTLVFMKAELERLENLFNRNIRCLDDLLSIIDEQFELWIKDGCRAVKITDAYDRDLFYEDSTREEAERVMNRVFTLKKIFEFQEAMTFQEARPLQNYIIHYFLRKAESLGFPVILHTGIQAGIGNEVRNSQAVNLTNLFVKYPRIRFHLLHANYPYMQEAACLAKQFVNVSLDLTWTNIIVPAGAREGLSHFLDMVPVNKIHGFGGDYRMPESVWGALEVARENIALVLTEKVEQGTMTEKEALEIARRILSDNIQEIIRFGE